MYITSYISVPYGFFHLVLRPTNVQLSFSYMFRHYRVIFRELVINKSLKTNVSYEIYDVKSASYVCDILL